MNFTIYLISINIIAFLIILIDKRRAIKKKWRIPENNLLLISLLGGCFGMYISMYLYHHKTKKLKFKLVLIFCFIWLYFIFSLFTNII